MTSTGTSSFPCPSSAHSLISMLSAVEGRKLFHEPWRVVEGTAGVQSTTTLSIP